MTVAALLLQPWTTLVTVPSSMLECITELVHLCPLLNIWLVAYHGDCMAKIIVDAADADAHSNVHTCVAAHAVVAAASLLIQFAHAHLLGCNAADLQIQCHSAL